LPGFSPYRAADVAALSGRRPEPHDLGCDNPTEYSRTATN